MRKTFTLLALIFSFAVQAQYHQEVLFPNDSGLFLLSKLVMNFKPAVVMDYSHAREKMYKEIYNVHDSVHCVYTDHTLYLDPSSTDPIGYLAKNGNANGINCEHTFPQSKGAETGNARSDMHHLFPSRAEVNSARSNYPFGEIQDNVTKFWYYQSKELTFIPSVEKDLYSESIDGLFEPREDHKGNVARAIFYFYTMYDIQADKTFFESMRSTLCDWHLKDVVDSAEYNRSILIGTYQENKANPFVLDCSLARRTYCPNAGSCSIYTSNNDVNQLNLAIYPNPNTGSFELESDQFLNIAELSIFNVYGQKIKFNYIIKSENRFQINVNPQDVQIGIYFIKLKLQDGSAHTKKFSLR